MKQISIIGCGPGNRDFLTAAAIKAVEGTEFLVGAEHLLDLFKHVDCPRIAVKGTMVAVLDEVEACVAGKVCVLVSGDPGIFSLARIFINRFGRDNCTLIPGISSIQLACARLAITWNDLRIISAHGRTPDITLDEMRSIDKIAMLAGDDRAVQWFCQCWSELGEDYEVAACENLSLETEKVRYFMSVDQVAGAEFASRTILFLCRKGILA